MARRIQRKKIIEVIEKDATGTDYLYDGKRMCVLGGLLHAAGVPKERLRNRAALSESDCETLELTYGLSVWGAHRLVLENDCHKTTSTRRKALIELVATL